METSEVITPDGRRIALFDGGDPDGYPVIGLHGTPGCRLSRWPDDSVYAEAGIRYVTTDRAGYGGSTRRPGRTVADEAGDVLAVADALGLRRFGVTGGSGGGPHALACAALLAGRVERVSCLAGLAPYGPDGLAREAWLAGMGADSAEEVAWAEAGEARLFAELPRLQRQMLHHAVHDIGRVLGDEAPDADRAFLTRPGIAEAMRRIVAEQCRLGVGGWVDDSLALLRPWGFDVTAIGVPVLLRYGLDDVSVPPGHGDWLAARIPGVHVIVDAEGGHLPLDPVAEIAHNMAWLATGRP